MSERETVYPLRRPAQQREWRPSIHYAQIQRMPTGVLERRRLYDFELLYVSQGEAATTIYGERHPLEAGQLIFLPSGVYHQNEAISAPYTKFMGIHFDFFDELDIQTEADMVVREEEVQPEKFAREPWTEGLPLFSSITVVTPPLPCVQLMEQLVEEFTMRSPGYEVACQGLMQQILIQLLRMAMTEQLQRTSEHSARLMELMAQIEARPEGGWTGEVLAQRLDLSRDHAAKLFRQAAGAPLTVYVQQVRHREARKLLRESDWPIERIGEAVGYQDIHYFSRLFRRLEGISPREYRKLSRIL
ncbi:AraC family transcriptional regulator [Paenibacillus sp. 598K]|uniref:AraC family transcriptional regulator n=1 Tax=Paenibacillus sp. 598K TaxID=1117987 RepID=UPI000FFA3AD6|nr:AraC family transcriptional regulator [Paenibacillus sp. 598K]GBF72256.1 AraC family transcriptional regulator [Paenibacillus sp. 598K]